MMCQVWICQAANSTLLRLEGSLGWPRRSPLVEGGDNNDLWTWTRDNKALQLINMQCTLKSYCERNHVNNGNFTFSLILIGE